MPFIDQLHKLKLQTEIFSKRILTFQDKTTIYSKLTRYFGICDNLQQLLRCIILSIITAIHLDLFQKKIDLNKVKRKI